MRDYLIVAAEYRQAVIEQEQAKKSVEQAESTVAVMRNRLHRSNLEVCRLSDELDMVALA
jgi:nitrate reductase assembly molybdenum cofactor insertion protein NarJ